MSDKYQNFAELILHENESEDFRIISKQGNLDWLVMAPHGGGIESQTSELTIAFARNVFSFYCFEGLKESGNKDLHITSANFDEPKAIKRAVLASNVITVHGCKQKEAADILIGGLDENRKSLLLKVLQDARYDAQIAVLKLLGKSPDNICNRGKTKKGLQLELRKNFRDELASDKNLFEKFTALIHEFLVKNA